MGTLVLDNEAVQAIADPSHPKHSRALAFCEAGYQRASHRPGRDFVVVPVAVRIEAGGDRTRPNYARVNLLSRARDVPLDSSRADDAAAIRLATGVSVVDATIGQVARAAEGPVQILTADGEDMRGLAAHLNLSLTVILL